ncbi:MAG: J domain-containing protein [Hyphomicrobiales bacterium]
MKLNSKYFDGIRVKPEQDRSLRDKKRGCDWPDCDMPGEFPAPRGRDSEGEYYHFCVNHVRQYNKSYNYFKGMGDDDVRAFQADARNGHRPTWRMGTGSTSDKEPEVRGKADAGYNRLHEMKDPFGLFEEDKKKAKPQRTVRNLERKALKTLSLDENSSAEDVKKQYKALVKRHHPDANGGSRASEDRFREIVQAYNYLKSVDFC